MKDRSEYRLCTGIYLDLVNDRWQGVKFDKAYFHCWGTEVDPYKRSVTHTVAIVELEDGKVVIVSPKDLTFIS